MPPEIRTWPYCIWLEMLRSTRTETGNSDSVEDRMAIFSDSPEET